MLSRDPRRGDAPLPERLLFGPFRYGEAVDAGVRRSRLGRLDVEHPHHGLYVAGGLTGTDLAGRCERLLPLLGPHRWFSHATAARLWGVPLPLDLDDEPLHVIAIGGAGRLRRPGVVGWEAATVRGRMRGVLPLVEPAEVWAQLATRGATAAGVTLTREWLVVAGDYLVSGARRPGTRESLCSIGDLRAALTRRRGAHGAKALAWALERIRKPVDSPKETQLRLGLVACGLPEPSVQVPVQTAAGLRHADLGYPDVKLLIEYLGEPHRASRSRWRQDLTRVQLFQDAGYRVVQVGADDVDEPRVDRPAAEGDRRDVDSGSPAADHRSPAGFGGEPGPGLRALAERVERALAGRTFVA